jgi:phosphoribosylamine--glycine ligase
MRACRDGKLSETEVKFSDKSACCVILASRGYPEKYEKGFEITADADFAGELFVAGAKKDGDRLLTDGGRVLGVECVGDTLKKAVDAAYEQVKKVRFDNSYYRKDIGARALKAIK